MTIWAPPIAVAAPAADASLARRRWLRRQPDTAAAAPKSTAARQLRGFHFALAAAAAVHPAVGIIYWQQPFDDYGGARAHGPGAFDDGPGSGYEAALHRPGWGLSLAEEATPSPAPKPAEPWYMRLESFPFPHLFAADLGGDRLKAISDDPNGANFMVVDFYAPWCPHCQHFAPEFERVAATIQRFNNARGAVPIASLLHSEDFPAGSSSKPSSEPSSEVSSQLSSDIWRALDSITTASDGAAVSSDASSSVGGGTAYLGTSMGSGGNTSISKISWGSAAASPGDRRIVAASDHWRAHRRKRPVLIAGTVDCVADSQLCKMWEVNSFPTVLFGPRKAFARGNRKQIENIDVFTRTAETVTSWIENRSRHRLKLASSGLIPSRLEFVELLRNKSLLGENASSGSPGQDRYSPSLHQGQSARVNFWDVRVATGLMLHNILSEHTLSDNKSEATSGAVEFINLLERRFPETGAAGKARSSVSLADRDGPLKSCRSSFADLRGLILNLKNRSDLYDGDIGGWTMLDVNKVEAKWTLCGDAWQEYGNVGWQQCRGTWPGKRGFTCGLWSLFHVLLANSTDTSAAKDLESLRKTIRLFFDCEDCRSNFLQIPYNKQAIKTRRDASVWLWQAHNSVNRRVGALEEQSEDGDPVFRKVQWPDKDICPQCHRSSPDKAWNETAVADFLEHYYGV